MARARMHGVGAFLPSVRYAPDAVKALFPEGAFKEIHVQCDLEVCKQRDPKGLYKKAAAGEINDFTGVSPPTKNP